MVFANMMQNTPIWVFVLFALLLVLGFQSLKPRTLPLWRLLIVPAVFIGWRLLTSSTKFMDQAQ
jgi:hypothetical protein